MKRGRWWLLAGVLGAIAAFFGLGLNDYLTLEAIQAQRDAIEARRAAQPLATAALFLLVYVLATGLSLPGAALLTLLGGAIFGLLWGTLIVSFASTIGATGAFLLSRYVLAGGIRRRYGSMLTAIDQGVARDGAFYLFTLRLVPVFPFFLINLLMGLTQMPARRFFWVSQVGMLPGTLVYVNAGRELARLESLAGILSPGLIAAFVLLGLFPWVARFLVERVRARKVYQGYQRPKRFDRNLIVIGAGSAGLVSAYIAAAVRARVTLIEQHRMGGDCLNTGCVPSKALIRTSRLMSLARRGREFGVTGLTPEVDFPGAIQRVHEVIDRIAPHDSVQRYTELGVDVVTGHGRLVDPWTVEITDPEGAVRRLTARAIVVATGAEPLIPPIPGLDQVPFLTSETLWSLEQLPKRLIVLGGGPIGCELTQAFARLGSRVTQVEMLDRLLIREDPEVSQALADRFRSEGVDLRLATRAKAVEVVDGETRLVVEHAGAETQIGFDQILVAVGRKARLSGFGLEALGIKTGRTLEVDDFLATRFPNIVAAGDVAGPYQFTHTAAHMAWYAAVNSLFAPLLAFRGGRFKVDYRVIPWATFTEPEVARVGLNEIEAREKGIAYEVVSYSLEDLDRAIADGEAHGLVKVLTVPGKDRILGVTIMGEHAGELIAEYVLAMRHGIGLNKILGTIHIYPTLAEANKYAAGLWKQAHKPEALLAWVERYHRWRRG